MERYGDLVGNVVRKYLFDEDDIDTVQTEIFAKIHRDRLGTYHGRSSLAAWVAVVARNITADHLRRRFGRREPPAGLRHLSPVHRKVFRLFYVEGSTFSATLAAVRERNPAFDEGKFLAVLRDIDARVSDKTLRRLAYDLAAQSVGAASGRLLEFCQSVAWEAETDWASPDPLTLLMRREAEGRARRILDLVAELPEEDREILSLRFEKGMRAREIAHRMGYHGPRRVFTVIDRIIADLRRRGARFLKDGWGEWKL